MNNLELKIIADALVDATYQMHQQVSTMQDHGNVSKMGFALARRLADRLDDRVENFDREAFMISCGVFQPVAAAA